MNKLQTMLAKQALVLAFGCIFIGILMSYGNSGLATVMGIWTLILLEYNRQKYMKEAKN